MATEEDKEMEEPNAAKDGQGEDEADSGNAGEKQGPDHSPTPKGITGLVRQFLALINHRWAWVSALVLALMLTGIVVLKGTPWTQKNEAKARSLSKERLIQDDLRQETLSRLYIPLPQDSPDRVLVIDFSVVWDGLSAVRFKKMEIQVRDRLYGFMVNHVKRGNDLQDKVSFLEAEMGRILRESLRTEDLAIKIKEIRAF